MASDINKVVLTCRLTRDPELRRTQSGAPILNLGVAFNDRRKNNQTGEWEDCGNFADCTMFGNRAESLANYLHKGSRVAIEGKLRWSQWERDGQKRTKLEVVIDELVMLDQRPQGEQQGGYQAYQPRPAQPQAGYQPQYQQMQQPAPQPMQQPVQQQMQMPAIDTASSVYDDDIPF